MKKGFKVYGIIGIILIFLMELNFFLKIQPFANWYFPIIWISYILVVDAIIFKLNGSSLISSRFKIFLGMVIISALFWYIFELTNVFINNWQYQGTEGLGVTKNLFGFISFATILPALFETFELIRSIKLFEKEKLKKSHKITKPFLYTLISIGIIFLILPVFLPTFTFPLVWLSFFLIFDPINYLNNQPSIIGHLKDKKLAVPLSILLSGIILGFFWEFWNYWAIPKWTYNIPFVDFFKIFEMPLLGYLGYFPFALEMYSMYWLTASLFKQKEKMLYD
ncbi:MAG: hypothetical protein Q8P57_01980 [Candidatus Pacearchaeota archaeon]|nr:hypothetical protein [Candidatus Pacearchaeota archaeon]